MQPKRSILIHYLLLLCCLGVISCSSSAESTVVDYAGISGKPRLQIAMIPKGSTIHYWKTVHAGAQKAAEELNVDLIWQDPLAQNNVGVQSKLVSEFVKRPVDAIILSPVNKDRLVPAVKNACAQKIPLVVIDSDLAEPCYNAYIGTDNFEFGKACARQLTHYIKEGNIAMLRYEPNHASTTQREEGFIAGVKEYAPELNVIISTKFAGVNAVVASQIAHDIIAQNLTLKAVFGSNGLTTEALLNALETHKLAGKIKLMGVDANEKLVKALEEGQISALGVQDPFMIGYLGVQTAVKAIKNQTFSKRISTKYIMVSKHNVNQSEVATFIQLKSKEPIIVKN